MKRILTAVGLLLALSLLALPALAEPQWRGWNQGLREAGAGKRPVLVDVYTDWCGWCKRMDRDVYSRRDVQDYLSRKFVTVRINAEHDDAASYAGRSYTSRTLASYFGVTGYPTTIFLASDGGHLANVPGYLPADQFLQLLRYVGDGYMDRGVSFEDFKKQTGAAR